MSYHDKGEAVVESIMEIVEEYGVLCTQIGWRYADALQLEDDSPEQRKLATATSKLEHRSNMMEQKIRRKLEILQRQAAR